MSEKLKVYCVTSFGGVESRGIPERREVFTDGDRRFVLIDGLRYRLNAFNEYHMDFMPRKEAYRE